MFFSGNIQVNLLIIITYLITPCVENCRSNFRKCFCEFYISFQLENACRFSKNNLKILLLFAWPYFRQQPDNSFARSISVGLLPDYTIPA